TPCTQDADCQACTSLKGTCFGTTTPCAGDTDCQTTTGSATVADTTYLIHYTGVVIDHDPNSTAPALNPHLAVTHLLCSGNTATVAGQCPDGAPCMGDSDCQKCGVQLCANGATFCGADADCQQFTCPAAK